LKLAWNLPPPSQICIDISDVCLRGPVYLFTASRPALINRPTDFRFRGNLSSSERSRCGRSDAGTSDMINGVQLRPQLAQGSPAMPDNTNTIQSFLSLFLTPVGNPTNAVNTVLTLFSPDSASPTVGIGGNIQNDPHGNPLGPVFTGSAQIKALFTELLSSFPNLTFTAYPNPQSPVICVAQNATSPMTIQAQLNTGNHVKQWFPPYAGAQRRYYSKPLSDIVPASNQSYVPVSAVFTFDTANPITTNQYPILNLALYLDRWQFAADLWAPGRYPFPYPVRKQDQT
jgi:hypothetical protein